MKPVGDLDGLKEYLAEKGVPRLAWFGQRASDFRGLEEYVDATGIFSCYGSSTDAGNVAVLSAQEMNLRRKQSVDTLLESFDSIEDVRNFLITNEISTILPYDTNPGLERLCKAEVIKCLSTPDALKARLGDKTFVPHISGELGIQSIPGVSGLIDDLEYDPLAEEFGLPLFLHFAEGAGGTGNYIVNSVSEFDSVRAKMRGKRLNVKKYISGKSCSIDICVSPTGVMCDTLEEMLIGAEPLNSNPTEYVGSSWYHNDYSPEIRQKISKIGVALGTYLRSQGFLGFFHPDFLVTEKDIYITELNMRFGGSCGAWTRIQAQRQRVPLMLMAALVFLDPEMAIDYETLNCAALEPCDYSLFILKNKEQEMFKIAPGVGSGIYNFNGTTLTFNRDKEDSVPEAGEILVNTLASGKEMNVETGALIAEVICRLPVSNSASKLNDDGKSLVAAVLSCLQNSPFKYSVRYDQAVWRVYLSLVYP